MDPLRCFGEDISPLILQHLSVRDLLKCTLVSTNWNNTVGSSRKAMAKIWLRFYEPFDDIECLLNSKRRYSNFKIQHGLSKKLIPAFEKFTWKNVMMRDDTDIYYDDLVDFFTKLAPSVETLDLWDIGTRNSNNEIKHINFPRLKVLELNLTDRNVLSLFFGQNPNLKKALITNDGMCFKNVQQELMEPTNLLHEFLIRNKIEFLKLMHCEWAFETDITEGLSKKFKEVTLTSSHDISENAKINIFKFIYFQDVAGLKASKAKIGYPGSFCRCPHRHHGPCRPINPPVYVPPVHPIYPPVQQPVHPIYRPYQPIQPISRPPVTVVVTPGFNIPPHHHHHHHHHGSYGTHGHHGHHSGHFGYRHGRRC